MFLRRIDRPLVEYFYVVDEDDRVIGKATREECHEKGLIHRSVYVFILNSKGELFIQKRSPLKDLYPGYYTGSATGHVEYGEDYTQAALRELKEELGISPPIKFVSKFKCFSETEKELSALFIGLWDGKIRFNNKEISEGFFMKFEELKRDIETGKKKFAPGFYVALKAFERFRTQSSSA